MAIYGVDLYAKSFYGIDIPVSFSVGPFLANQYEHGNLALTWTTPRAVSSPQSTSKSWSSLRLIRNFYGFPVNQTDGAILLECPNTAPAQSYNDTTVPDGRFAYYAIFVLTTHDAWSATQNYSVGDQVTYSSQNWVAIAASFNQSPGSGSAWSTSSTATEWVLAGATVGLAVADWHYSEFLYEHTPRAYKVNVVETTGSNPDFNNDLWKFMQIFGFGFDIMKTENDALRRINDVELTRDRYVLAMAEQMGIGEELPDEPLLRRLRVKDATVISRQKGSIAGLQTLVKDTTGWGASITQGYNLLLDIDQASFAHPVLGTWDPGMRYQNGEIIRYSGAPWQVLIANRGVVPSATSPQPSAATPEYWKPLPTLASPYTWRGWWVNTADYAVNDVVAWSGSSSFVYTCTTASGPNHGGAVTPGGAGWSGTAAIPGTTPTVTFVGVWNPASAYSVNIAVMDAASPNGNAWVAAGAVPANSNPYWLSRSPVYADLTNPITQAVIYNPTTHGISTWTPVTTSTSISPLLFTMVDGVAASGSNAPRNVLEIASNTSTGGTFTLGAQSVSKAYYGSWSSATVFLVGSVVAYKGLNYICIAQANNLTATPDTDKTHWASYTVPQGEYLASQQGVPLPRVRAWDHNRTYSTGDKVTANRNIYQATFSTTGVSPSGYRVDSRGWRWLSTEQIAYTASAYYRRSQNTTVATTTQSLITWFGPKNNLIKSVVPQQYPPFYDRFEVDGSTGGTDPGSYSAFPTFGSPQPITWINAYGGPWNVDYGVAHTTYPATNHAGQFLLMDERAYGSVSASNSRSIYVTFVRTPFDPNQEQGIVFLFNPTARTYLMLSRTRLTQNTYNAGLTSTTITQVGSSWTNIADGSRVRVTISSTNNTVSGFIVNTDGTTTSLFSVSNSFSTAGTYHGLGERPIV